MKRACVRRLIVGALLLLVWANPLPLLAQDVICCMNLIGVGGKPDSLADESPQLLMLDRATMRPYNIQSSPATTGGVFSFPF